MKPSSTATLIAAMRVLSREIQSGDGVANAALGEAADRLEDLHDRIERIATGWAAIDLSCKCAKDAACPICEINHLLNEVKTEAETE